MINVSRYKDELGHIEVILKYRYLYGKVTPIW